MQSLFSGSSVACSSQMDICGLNMTRTSPPDCANVGEPFIRHSAWPSQQLSSYLGSPGAINFYAVQTKLLLCNTTGCNSVAASTGCAVTSPSPAPTPLAGTAACCGSSCLAEMPSPASAPLSCYYGIDSNISSAFPVPAEFMGSNARL